MPVRPGPAWCGADRPCTLPATTGPLTVSTPTLRQLQQAEPALIEPLSALLIDSVHGGASVGFLAPLATDKAQQYWAGVMAAIGPAGVLWVAELDGRVVGTVQLSLCTKDNGRHRAELQKLLVLSTHRGHGLARRLVAAAEDFAVQHAMSLLVLDTLAGSPAEGLYAHLGWHRVGEIPEYAGDPQGRLCATVVFCKTLMRSSG